MLSELNIKPLFFSFARDPERRRVRGPEQIPVPCRHHPLAGRHEEPSGRAAGGAVQQQRLHV